MLSWTHITNFKVNKVLLVKTVSSQEDGNDVNKVQQRLPNTLLCLGFSCVKCINSYLNVFLLSMIKCTKWQKANKYKKTFHHPATAYSWPEKDNIGMLPSIEIFFARSLTWAVNSLFVTCHVTQITNNESVPHVRKTYTAMSRLAVFSWVFLKLVDASRD